MYNRAVDAGSARQAPKECGALRQVSWAREIAALIVYRACRGMTVARRQYVHRQAMRKEGASAAAGASLR